MKTLKNLMNLVIIPILAWGLNGCSKEYNIDGEIVKYNKFMSEPLRVIKDDSLFVYRTAFNPKVVDALYIYDNKGFGKKTFNTKIYNRYGKGAKRIINEEQNRFTNYLNKINLIESK